MGILRNLTHLNLITSNMKLPLTFLSIFLLTALCQAEAPDRSPVLKKVVKRAIQGLGGRQQFENFVNLVSQDCRLNGATKEQIKKLKDDFNGIPKCLKKYPIFVTEKEEFLEHVRECSKETIREAKECLSNRQQYLPGLTLKIFESLIGFLYDDIDIIKGSFAVCVRKFNRYDVMRSYHNCVVDETLDAIEAEAAHDDEFPDDSKSFCDAFVGVSSCLPKIVKEYCEDNEDLRKFRRDYLAAVKKPCESVKSVQVVPS